MKFKLIITCEYELEDEFYCFHEAMRYNSYVEEHPFTILEDHKYTVKVEEVS